MPADQERTSATDYRCVKMCPMDVRIPEYIMGGRHVLSTECSLCQTCITVCARDALKLAFGFDLGGKELLREREAKQALATGIAPAIEQTARAMKGERRMKDRVCMITGASSGIGQATALGLAGMGATVVIVARDRDRGQGALDEVKAATGNQNTGLLLADLSSQAEVRRLAEEFKSRYSHLHVLINNAGVALSKRTLTVDGIEMVLAVNYLAPFLLTNLLLDLLKASAPARVVNVAGDFHRKATIRFDDLMSEKEYSGVRANNQAKLALILFTYELARRLDGTRVTANCLHPGAVATGSPLKDPDLSTFGRVMYRLVKPFFQSPEKGAETPIYLASSPEVEGLTAKYLIKKRAVASSPESYDEDIARRLWATSAELTGLAA